MATTSAELQRQRYHGIKNGTWDVSARRAERLLTECASGHPYIDGSYVWKSSSKGRWRRCIECHNANQRKRHQERMATDPTYVIKCIIRNHNVRAKKLNDPHRLTVDDVNWMWETYGRACLACGSLDRPTIDHVVPVIHGGLNTRENIQPLCRLCNSTKYNTTVDYRPQT